MKQTVKRLALAAAACVLAVGAALVAVELWVRGSWDPKRGTPGLFQTDAVLALRLTPGYEGWFAGVPVRINNLGHRDDRDYDLEKPPGTFRILVLGDSVTFGHGSVYEHTYPYLLEQRLREWRPDIGWQVWNSGVPGYNSSQELAYLLRVGPHFRPDLVIVGFFPNDLSANDIVTDPGALRRASTEARNWLRQRFYSMEFYRRAYLQAQWRWFASPAAQRLLQNLADEDALLADPGQVANLPQQRLTPVERLTDAEVAAGECKGRADALREIEEYVGDPAYQSWLRAVDGFHALHRTGTYRIVFFVQAAPEPCPGQDLFFDAGSRYWNDFFMSHLERAAPTISTYDELMHHRPSQMPAAGSHSLGNTNRLKADLLFAFLKEQVL